MCPAGRRRFLLVPSSHLDVRCRLWIPHALRFTDDLVRVAITSTTCRLGSSSARSTDSNRCSTRCRLQQRKCCQSRPFRSKRPRPFEQCLRHQRPLATSCRELYRPSSAHARKIATRSCASSSATPRSSRSAAWNWTTRHWPQRYARDGICLNLSPSARAMLTR